MAHTKLLSAAPMSVPDCDIILRICGYTLKTFLYHGSFLAIFYIPLLLATTTVDELLDKGTRLLSAGQLDDALSIYQQAAQDYPDNHLVYYKRGTAYLAVGNFRSAFNDFDKSVQLNSDYLPATKQRAKLNLKLGNLKEAIADYELLEPTDSEAKLRIVEVRELQDSVLRANNLYSSKNFGAALPLLDKLTDAMKYNDHMREMRALCLLNLGEVQKGIQELRYAVHLTNDNREGLLRVSKLMYDSGFAVQSLEEIRECLKLDPDHQGCFKFYKQVKKIAKAIVDAQDAMESENYASCIESANNILKLEPEKMEYKHQAEVMLCECYAKSKSADGIPYCETIVERNPENIDYLLYKAESYSNAERYEDAISAYQKVMDLEPRNPRAQEGVKKNQQLLKSSKRRNYYKILGVSKSATKKEILKAYRKLAAEHHPDNADEKDKQRAQAKFMDIAAAKEVLADDEKRSLYDSGVDPLDPEQQHQQQGPFGHPFGGFPFGNMHPFEGAHFEFHFG